MGVDERWPAVSEHLEIWLPTPANYFLMQYLLLTQRFSPHKRKHLLSARYHVFLGRFVCAVLCLSHVAFNLPHTFPYFEDPECIYGFNRNEQRLQGSSRVLFSLKTSLLSMTIDHHATAHLCFTPPSPKLLRRPSGPHNHRPNILISRHHSLIESQHTFFPSLLPL